MNHNTCSLNGVTTTGAGTEFSPGFAPKAVSMQVRATGSPTACIVKLEGTNNGGQDWFTMATWDITTETSGDNVTVTNVPVTSMRANLTTLTGGTSPTVTAHIAASQ